MEFTLRPIAAADRPWLREFVRAHWGAEELVDRQRVLRPAEHPGFVAENAGAVVGVVTHAIRAGACEVTMLNSLHAGHGIGGALLEAVLAEARAQGCRRLWLLTTNDNLNALRFYQKRGLRLARLHPGAVDEARRLKPDIPRVGEYGIPLRDELELELVLT